MKDWPDLLNAIATVLWPILALGVLMAIGPALRGVIRNRPFTIKVGAFEMSAQEASEKVADQIADLQRQVSALKAAGGLQAGDETTVSAPPPKASPRHVLWVDDHPEHNAFEIERLREAGAEVVTVTTTPDAIARIRQAPQVFDALVTDLGRREGLTFHRTAGLDTIEKARSAGFSGQAIVYTSEKGVAASGETAREMDVLLTASPTDLYDHLGVV